MEPLVFPLRIKEGVLGRRLAAECDPCDHAEERCPGSSAQARLPRTKASNPPSSGKRTPPSRSMDTWEASVVRRPNSPHRPLPVVASAAPRWTSVVVPGLATLLELSRRMEGRNRTPASSEGCTHPRVVPAPSVRGSGARHHPPAPVRCPRAVPPPRSADKSTGCRQRRVSKPSRAWSTGVPSP
jgi:hypothetical protein